MKTKVIILANQKGGVGKSVLSSLIATEFYSRFKNVCLLDCDEQGTINHKRTTQVIQENATGKMYDVYRVKTLEEYISFMRNQKENYEYIIVDTKGEFSEKIINILSQANFIIIPLQESDAEMMSLEYYIRDCFVPILRQKDIKIIPVLNRVNMKSSEWKTFYEQIPLVLNDYNIKLPKMRVPNTLGLAKQWIQLGDRISYRKLDTVTPMAKRKGIPKIVKQECNYFINSLIEEINN